MLLITRTEVSPTIESALPVANSRSRQYTITLVLAALLALGSVYYFAGKSQAVYRAGYFDLPIFTQAAIRYWKNDPVYQRGDDLAELYRPGAIVYKFPLPYLINFLPWFDESGAWPPGFHMWITVFFICLYVLMLLVSCRLVLGCCTERPAIPAMHFVLLVIACAGVFMPFFVVQGGTSAEVYIIALSVLAFAVMQRFPYLAGFLLVWLASIKLYPVFLLLYPILTRQWRVLLSAVVGGCFIVLLSIAIFGWGENWFYLQNILPVLLSEPVSEDWTAMFRHTTGNQCIVKVLVGYGMLPSRLPIWLNAVRLPFVFAMLWLLWKHCRRHDDKQWTSLIGFVLVVLTMMICLPNICYSYFVMLLFPAIVLAGFLWAHKRYGWLLLLFFFMVVFAIDDNWTYALAQSLVASADSKTIAEEVERIGIYAYLWKHQVLLLLLWCQGLVAPFVLYVLWFFSAMTLRMAAFNRRHIPA